MRRAAAGTACTASSSLAAIRRKWSSIPKASGERIKTDRRDAIKLARLARSGDLTPVWIPDTAQEAMRDLTRAKDDLKAQERKARQQLNAFVLRHCHHWPNGRTR
jgi:transposase